ncbi:MAG: hypothetical protein FXF54_04810 [Kosmotoga sp.]|nr:MAG: hypothetical protein FXF54_04810 [Kosmotoga sp.]
MKKAMIFLFIAVTASVIASERATLPIFSMPKYDMTNRIIEVFYEKTEDNSKLEMTVVFKDEDHPCFLIDIIYDAYRYFKYGRIPDIETFFLHLNDNGTLEGIEFPGVYAGNHKFTDTEDLHGSAYFSASEVEFINERQIIYVNTWNHMFSIEPAFSYDDEILIYDYPTSKGTRANSEVKYSWKH